MYGVTVEGEDVNKYMTETPRRHNPVVYWEPNGKEEKDVAPGINK